MTVISVNEKSARGLLSDDGQREWTVEYLVRTDNRKDGPIQVLTDVLSPAYASSYQFGGLESDPGAFRQSASAELIKEEDTAKLYLMTLVYSSRPIRRPDKSLFGGGSSGTDDPTTIERISGSFYPFTETFDRDITGRTVQNGCKEPFVDALRERTRATINIEHTYSESDFITLFPTLMKDLSLGRVNDATWWYHSERKWRIAAAPWDQVYHGETKYYTVFFSFELDWRTWDYEPANRGPRFFPNTDFDDRRRFTDEKGLDYGGDGLGSLEANGTRRSTTADPPIIYFDGAGADSAGPPFKRYVGIDFSDRYSLPSDLS